MHSFSNARTIMLTRSTEGLSAPLASLYSAVYAHKHLSDFCVYQLQLPTIFWGRCFTLYSQSPACGLTGCHNLIVWQISFIRIVFNIYKLRHNIFLSCNNDNLFLQKSQISIEFGWGGWTRTNRKKCSGQSAVPYHFGDTPL